MEDRNDDDKNETKGNHKADADVHSSYRCHLQIFMVIDLTLSTYVKGTVSWD